MTKLSVCERRTQYCESTDQNIGETHHQMWTQVIWAKRIRHHLRDGRNFGNYAHCAELSGVRRRLQKYLWKEIVSYLNHKRYNAAAWKLVCVDLNYGTPVIGVSVHCWRTASWARLSDYVHEDFFMHININSNIISEIPPFSPEDLQFIWQNMCSIFTYCE